MSAHTGTEAPAAKTAQAAATAPAASDQVRPDGVVVHRTGQARLRAFLPWLAVFVVGTAVLFAIALATPPAPTDLDPESAKPGGAKALATVLADHGVQVDVVRSILAFEHTDLSGATVFLSRPEDVSADNLARVANHVGTAARFVVAAPDQVRLDALGIPVRAYPRWTDSAQPADCTIDLLPSGATMTGGTWAYEPLPGTEAQWQGCFAGTGDTAYPLLAQGPFEPQRTVLLGWSHELDNAHITQESAAALALTTLGATDHLVWYQPGPGDVVAAAQADQRGGLVLPAWFGPLTWLLMTGVVFLAVIQGRRLGRVVPEQLPVVVRAVETTENLGSLYRRAGDRARTAETLRSGTVTRLRRALGVGRGAGLVAVVEATAQASGMPPTRVSQLLTGPVEDDQALVRLAADLADLERKVRQP